MGSAKALPGLFSGLVVIAGVKLPIPSRTRPISAPTPMVLRLKTWESRSPPDLKRDASLKNDTIGAGWSSPVARQAHNLKVTGSNPVPATKTSTNKTHRQSNSPFEGLARPHSGHGPPRTPSGSYPEASTCPLTVQILPPQPMQLHNNPHPSSGPRPSAQSPRRSNPPKPKPKYSRNTPKPKNSALRRTNPAQNHRACRAVQGRRRIKLSDRCRRGWATPPAGRPAERDRSCVPSQVGR